MNSTRPPAGPLTADQLRAIHNDIDVGLNPDVALQAAAQLGLELGSTASARGDAVRIACSGVSASLDTASRLCSDGIGKSAAAGGVYLFDAISVVLEKAQYHLETIERHEMAQARGAQP